MDDNKISRVKIGATYLIITVNKVLALKGPPRSNSAISDLGFIIYPTKIQVANAVIGIIILLLRKSNRSRNCMPIILTVLHALYPRQDSSPSATQIPNTRIHADLRPIPSLSRKMETIVSMREIAEVSAANSTIIKNVAPMMDPPGMVAKTLGNVTNISPGP